MQFMGLSGDGVVHVVEIVGISALTVGGYWVTNQVKEAVREMRTELLEKLNNSKEQLVEKLNAQDRDMASKHAENTRVISSHAASDEAKFEAISRTLTRIDNKLS